jgi:hypothetical protein
MQHLRFFLSSTAVDLGEFRKEILRFLQIIPSDLVAMEFFGSDEAHPKEYCLEQVATCNYFIGIYAERYGTIDPATGLSITELEYRLAKDLLDQGKVFSILVYLIDPNAEWPIKFLDRNPDHVSKLTALKNDLKNNHVVTFFARGSDLPFLILKDVIKKIGVGDRVFRPSAVPKITAISTLTRPIGMEYFSVETSSLFRGRNDEVQSLTRQLIDNRLSLLIGASGIGKTSIVHAGLFAELQRSGWRIAIVRPMVPLVETLKQQLWSQVMEGQCPLEISFAGVVKICASAHSSRHLIVVIDQFEDAFAPRAKGDVADLINNLVELRMAAGSNFRILVSYRADAEADAGPIWQTISGDAGGLARTYLGPLTRLAALEALETSLAALGLKSNFVGEVGGVARRIIDEIESESFNNGFSGIFPPFLQMVVSEVYRFVSEAHVDVGTAYAKLGGARSIISDFLLRQLRILGGNESLGRRVLIALVSSYGTKMQKSLDEIASEIGESTGDAREALNDLQSLRIVRAVEGAFEIAHDFLAKRIVNEIVDSDEKDAKRAQELLSSRASVYPFTRSLLGHAEHLYVYKYRERISCSEDEARFLTLSGRSNGCPFGYWTRKLPAELVSSWKGEAESFENGEVGPPKISDWVLADPKLREIRVAKDIKYLLRTLDHPKGFEYRLIAKRRLVALSSSMTEPWVQSIALSRTPSKISLFAEICSKLASDVSILWCIENLQSRKTKHQNFAAIALGCKGDTSHISIFKDLVSSSAGKSMKQQFCLGFAFAKLCGRLKEKEILRGLISHGLDGLANGAIAACRETDDFTYQAIASQAHRCRDQAIAALARLATKQTIPYIRGLFFDPANRGRFHCAEILRAIYKFGTSADFVPMFEFVQRSENKIDISYSASLFQAAAFRLSYIDRAVLKEVIETRAFREVGYSQDGPLRPIAVNSDNNYLLRWLSALPFLYTCSAEDKERVLHLMDHRYWYIRNAAIATMARIARIGDMVELVEKAQAEAEPDKFTQLLTMLDRRFYLREGQPGGISYRPKAGPLKEAQSDFWEDQRTSVETEGRLWLPPRREPVELRIGDNDSDDEIPF